MTPPLLNLTRFRLRNFRCFESCEVELSPDLTVFVAENGRGKTAILDGIGIALGTIVDALTGGDQYGDPKSTEVRLGDFKPTDVRRVRSDGQMTPRLPTEFEAQGYAAGFPLHLLGVRQGVGRHKTMLRGPEDIDRIISALRKAGERNDRRLEGKAGTLPLIAKYGADRVWSVPSHEEEQRERRVPIEDRFAGYEGALAASSSMRSVATWYGVRANQTKDPRYSEGLRMNLSLLSAVREATHVVLEPTGWDRLDWDFEQQQLVVDHQVHGRFPLAALSDGIRNMVALVGDIARRCATLNPHLGENAARVTPGVLLIDEIDTHLHPGWQQQVVSLLHQAFPALQILLTTHSPHVLSTVERTSIRIIRFSNGRVEFEVPKYQTRGVESADILARIMGVDPIPHVEEAQWLSDYRALVQQGKEQGADGHRLWEKLIRHFGQDHPAIEELMAFVRLHQFARTHSPR